MVSRQACCITGCSGSRTVQKLQAQAPQPHWLPCTSTQLSCSLLLSCPSNQGCREQAAATAAESPSGCASLPELPCMAQEPGGEPAAPQRSASSNGSCSQPPFCPGVICLSHPRHETLVWWESSQAAISKGWGRVGAVAAARTIHLTHSLFLTCSRAVPREEGYGNRLWAW